MTPTVSILLPTHDREDVIGFAIRSVLAQTRDDWELLIAGDGCTDGTAAVVASFDDPRIRWYDLRKAPGFGYANRNRVLADARGELVAFMAHDDLWLPDHLERMVPLFDDPAVAWAHSRPAWVSRHGLVVPLPVDLRRPAQREYAFAESNTIPAACVVYRRSVGEAVGGWPEDAPRRGDRILWQRILDAAGPGGLAAIPEVTALHFIAEWRRAPVWGARPFDAWMPTLQPGSEWPETLQVQVPSGTQEQAAVWERLAADGAGWTAGVRAATGPAIERLAWDGILAIHDSWTAPPLMAELEREVTELRGALEEARRSPVASAPSPSSGTAPTAGMAAKTSGGRTARLRGLPVPGRLRRSGPVLAIRARVRNPLFDAAWYLEQYPAVRGARFGAFRHWRRHGWKEGRRPNRLFDTAWYLARYPDVARAGVDPLEHYLRWGSRDGRDPGPRFSTRWYLERYPDVGRSGMDPLLHYLRHGAAEGRRAHPREG
jgi:hypothetical protein